jgi:hypothetical protein
LFPYLLGILHSFLYYQKTGVSNPQVFIKNMCVQPCVERSRGNGFMIDLGLKVRLVYEKLKGREGAESRKQGEGWGCWWEEEAACTLFGGRGSHRRQSSQSESFGQQGFNSRPGAVGAIL